MYVYVVHLCMGFILYAIHFIIYAIQFIIYTIHVIIYAIHFEFGYMFIVVVYNIRFHQCYI